MSARRDSNRESQRRSRKRRKDGNQFVQQAQSAEHYCRDDAFDQVPSDPAQGHDQRARPSLPVAHFRTEEFRRPGYFNEGQRDPPLHKSQPATQANWSQARSGLPVASHYTGRSVLTSGATEREVWAFEENGLPWGGYTVPGETRQRKEQDCFGPLVECEQGH